MNQSRKSYRYVPATISLAAGFLFLTPVRAQDSAPSTPTSKVERKNQAPVSSEVLRVKLPKPVEAKLKNGLTVLIAEDHRFPAISVQLQISAAGALYEPENVAGLASVTAQMLREGTKSRDSKQIAEETDKLGASFGGSAEFGSSVTNFSASGLSDNFDSWFPLALEVLLHPSFPARELDNLKQRLAVQLRQQRAAPGFLASERFNRALFGQHPAAIVSATAESLESLTPAVLAQWHRERYVPQNAILGFAGNVRAGELIPKLDKWLADWDATSLKETLPANPVPSTER
jgi:zinc protease